MGIRDLAETAPFEGDYTGRHLMNLPTCHHVYRRFQGKRINPIRCLRFAETKAGYCKSHGTESKRAASK